jgi:signal transduction histidine kinase
MSARGAERGGALPAEGAALDTQPERTAVELRRARDEAAQARDVQAATAEILRVIAGLGTDIQPVLDAIARNAKQLCGGLAGGVFRFDGELVDLVASDGLAPAAVERARAMYPMRPDRTQLAARAIMTGKVQRLEDVSKDAEYAMDLASTGGWRRLLAVPILRGATPLGVIVVSWRNPGPIPDRQVELLKTFADQAVIAIENARLLDEIHASYEQQQATADVLRVMSESRTDITPVFESIMQHAVALCGAQHGILFRYDGELQHVVAQHNYPPEADRLVRAMYPGRPRRDQASGRAILEQTVQRIENARLLPGGATRLATVGGWTRILSVPMVRHGLALGTISVSWSEPGPITETQVRLLKTFADEAAIAVENVRLFNETKEALDQQRALAEVLGTIAGSIADTEPVFDAILDSCQRLFEGYFVGLTLAGEDGLVHLGAYKGENKEQVEHVYPYPIGRDSGSGQAILDQKVVQIADVDAPDTPLHVVRGAQAVGFKSVVFAPLIAEGHSIGALWVGRRLPEPFGERQIALLKTFADQAVIAIRNARLFHETQEKSRQLEVANRHKSEFLANMSHELRTPLNAIIGFTRIVMRRAKDQLEAKQYDNLGKILMSGQHLLSLINAVLDLAKVEAGRVEVRAEEIELAPVLEQCMRTIEPLVKAELVALIKDFDPALPPVYVDEEKLRQIVINLLSNAAKFTAQGSIRLQARAANGSIAIAVTDTGAGIPADKLGVIFEQFEQLDTSSTRVVGGTGLGLTISRRLARLMRGDIRVESALGAGSTFTLMLPTRYSTA